MAYKLYYDWFINYNILLIRYHSPWKDREIGKNVEGYDLGVINYLMLMSAFDRHISCWLTIARHEKIEH